MLLSLAVLLVGCTAPAEEPTAGRDDWFTEVAADSGLVFHHFLGSSGEYYFPETASGGVALFDYDGDGDLDVFLPQGAMLDESVAAAESKFPPDPRSWPGDRLYRNDTGKSGLRFVDVSAAAGLEVRGYGMGATAADYDRDGDVDLYVTRFGSNTLYRNDGAGGFEDVTASGVDDPRWSSGASFSDYDRDGDLDLLVASYVDFTIAGARPCAGPAGQRDYCGPMTYEPLPDRLLRNDGGDRFTDVTEPAGLHAAFGSGLGVVASDFDGDGLPDFFVANDQRANQLWRNRGDGTFEDIALLSGTALNEDGQAEASMGLAVGDIDQDGDDDLLITHLEGETNTLYLNQGGGNFIDATTERGLAAPSRSFTGFGTGWLDFDHDGRLDLFVANGAVKTTGSQRGSSEFPFRQKNQLLRNLGDGRFEDVSDRAGPALEISEVSRGAALGDIDNDGDADIVVANINGPVSLLRNELPDGGSWLLVTAIAGSPAASVVGARVGVTTAANGTLWRSIRTDGSYLSTNDHRAHFGLKGAVDAIVEVEWPDGHRTRWLDLPADRVLTVRRRSESRR